MKIKCVLHMWQVVGGVPCYWGGADLLAVPDSASDSIHVQLGLLCGSL